MTLNVEDLMKKNNVYELPSLSVSLSLIGMAANVEKLKAENKKINEQAARTILRALDAKDHYTFGHSMRVAYLNWNYQLFFMILEKSAHLMRF